MAWTGAAPEQAVILVGELPALRVDVDGRTLLSSLLWHVGRFGFRRALLLAGHRAEIAREQAQALAPAGVEVEVVGLPRPLGSAGALRFAADRFDERVLLMNGDSLFDFNWLDLVQGDDGACDVVMALRRTPGASRFGVAQTDGACVTGLRQNGDAGDSLTNGGVYLLHRRLAEACPKEGSFERDVLPAVAAQGRVRGREARGFFLDIGAPDALSLAQTATSASLRRPAVFFDRDGVLNEDAGYTHRPEDLRWTPGAVEAVKAVADAGWFAFLVTNQAGVARGLYGEAQVQAFNAHMQAELRRGGAHLDAMRYCPHHPQGTVAAYARACDHRKPGPGMILDLLSAWPVDAARSIMIGDKSTDMEAAAAAGIRGVRYAGGDLAAQVGSLLA